MMVEWDFTDTVLKIFVYKNDHVCTLTSVWLEKIIAWDHKN